MTNGLAPGGWGGMVLAAGALALGGWAGWLDWHRRRIPNWLTVPALFLGLALSTLLGRWPSLKSSLEGAGIALGILLPFVLMRGLGAGDWKLMGATGAFLGPVGLIVVLLGTVLIAAAMALVEAIRQGKGQATLVNLGVVLLAYSTFQVNYARTITLDNPRLLKIPFGVAAALSTILFFMLISIVWLFKLV